LTAPERFEQFKREVRRLLDAERGSMRHQDRERTSRLAQLDTEIGNLTDAIASGALRASPALAARLQAAESERATLSARTEARAAKIADFLPRLQPTMHASWRTLRRRYSATWTAQGITCVPCWVPCG
jgi:hypothetical protein